MLFRNQRNVHYCCPAANLFVKLVTDQVQSIPKQRKGDNLTRAQRKAIDEIRRRQDVVIKPSDKDYLAS